MARRNTKEAILYEALKLFSDKGYDGVSVRDIAGQVGIKQSSLYKHYTSKQDIFDSLVKTMQTRFMDSEICSLPCGELKEIAREYATVGNEILKKNQCGDISLLSERSVCFTVSKTSFH